MLNGIINFSVRNKLIVILFTLTIFAFGLYTVFKIPVGAVPDITNNQVQVITTSGNLSTQEIEQYITAPVEMEMANLPGVKEIRSVSKFGISLVTIVFDERLGTYLPRQLIAEKIKSAAAKIPEGFGVPEMGPITTGLGEIYQYTLDVQKGFEGKYSAMELRTIQDWVIKRRLSGIPGVVEINSWGGYLKQYEIAIDPSRLASMDITLMEVFDALATNNTISGGSYLEKTNQSYFIRGDGQVKSTDDIESIVVKNRNGTPVLIRDLASVRFGHANRYGAITANGKGETILGQVMMLKNANSKDVIQNVKDRVSEIQKNLPEGIVINPIVDRSELVAKTTFTVVENLILGALIVMFTVMLILGNLRSALVITSVIPLALLFTISMMYIFGIDANLMSLGALDFGIIIDGAVIIVEYIALKVTVLKDELDQSGKEKRIALMDKVAFEGSSKMMESAIFGQIIILIVFIPILSLSGVEGKMFRPMALSFCFAIIGAMIVGLTWVPVASALFLRPGKKGAWVVSRRIMELAHRSYAPVIAWSCHHKRIVLGAALFSLLLAGVLFSRMGGEFVPTLDEGDFVIQPVLKTGTSLSKTVEMTTRMENILISGFPEVDKVVSRIGAAEVPTDPMSMEEIDMIIKLKPRNTWTSAKSKEELAEKFKEALSVIPGIEYEFTQPIEMRFNELITGVRSDIAIKIFGEDLDYINKKAIEIKSLIETIPGAGDVILEKTAGLPQIRVDYQRSKIAWYGLDIAGINRYLSTAFGGESCGVVFEGEKRFDVVVRFDQEHRKDITDIRQLKIPLPDGKQIPLSEVADIQYAEGPAKISRENAHRRVVVSVNVRNRDLQSVVEDIRAGIEKNVTLKPGTYISYGGQFENLQSAVNRLLVAVPVALILIFIFLHFAFRSFKDALLIFSSIPLATVGGIVALWLRGMPFSVSAGVGFIALFGIAVLNGIVLIEHLKEMKQENFACLRDMIIQGTKERLRPVMLTAGAAAMGFLPMAISTGAGAEVQRPLATVVIGGLFTSTLLTMVALPLLFELFHNIRGFSIYPFKILRDKTCVLILLILAPFMASVAQNPVVSLEDAVSIALKNNKLVRSSAMNTEEKKALLPTAFPIDKTLLTFGNDQNNIAENGHPLWVWGVEQSINFPTLWAAEKKARTIDLDISQEEYNMRRGQIAREVSLAYTETQRLESLQTMNLWLDSLYTVIVDQMRKKLQLGDITNLDLLNAEVRQQQSRQRVDEFMYSIENSYRQLKVLMGTDTTFSVTPGPEIIRAQPDRAETSARYRWLMAKTMGYDAAISVEKNRLAPDILVNYFIGTNFYTDSRYYQGFQVGLAVPLFYGAGKARTASARISAGAGRLMMEYELASMLAKRDELLSQQKKYAALISQYETTGIKLYDELIWSANLSFEKGETDFYRMVTTLENALDIRRGYLENLTLYNRYTIELIYLAQ